MTDQPLGQDSDRRSEPRYPLDDNVQVIDLGNDSTLGVIMDLHSHGFMLMCPKGAEQSLTYSLKFLLPRHINGCSELALHATCLWTAESMSESEDMQWAGFAVVSVSEHAVIRLQDIVAEFGIEPKD
ncbi:hypothetical protein [Halioxenophilus aromaticivorans]|uniref:PilZ domain-containing protein n=1 Tax=Halioxenophilus aromaticivorans TaxID=1306992 RepID=A0AAV3U9V9_9ALTE